jgi:hypothetical protein
MAKRVQELPLVSSLAGHFDKAKWADAFSAALGKKATQRKSQAEIQRAICCAFQLFKQFFAACGDKADGDNFQKSIQKAAKALETAGTLMVNSETWSAKMSRALRNLPKDAESRDAFQEALEDVGGRFDADDEEVKALFESEQPAPKAQKREKVPAAKAVAQELSADTEAIVAAIEELGEKLDMLGEKLDSVVEAIEAQDS